MQARRRRPQASSPPNPTISPTWLDELATADDDTPLPTLRTTSDPCVTSADVTVAIIRDLFFESDESGTILVLNNTNRDEAKQRLAILRFVEE